MTLQAFSSQQPGSLSTPPTRPVRRWHPDWCKDSLGYTRMQYHPIQMLSSLCRAMVRPALQLSSWPVEGTAWGCFYRAIHPCALANLIVPMMSS